MLVLAQKCPRTVSFIMTEAPPLSCSVRPAPGGLVQRPRPARQHQDGPAAPPQPGGGHPGSHQPGAEHRQPGEKSVGIATAPGGN